MQPAHLVLLPGLDGTGVLFRPLLEHLPPHVSAVAVEYPRDRALGYTELIPFVLDALPRDRPFVLLAESFGGPLAVRVAATRPDGLTALILCASFVSCPHPLVPKWAAAFVTAFPFRAFPELSRLKAWLGGYSTGALRALSREALSSVRPAVLAHRTREVIRTDVARDLAGLDVPLLYIQGRYDLVVPGGNLERIRRIKPTVRVAQLPAPHMVLQTRAEGAAAAIAGFLVDCEKAMAKRVLEAGQL
jgi:pimeloyl-ACP methyl ester carboxylesterase